MRALRILAGLAPINFAFALIPGAIGAVVLLTGWIACLLVVAGGAYFLIATLSSGFTSDAASLSVVFFLIGVTGGGFLLCLFMRTFSLLSLRLLRRWLRWNFDFLIGVDKA